MQEYKDLAQYALEALKRRGADGASCYIRRETQTEANLENGEFSLLRTFTTDKIELKAIAGQKAGSATASLLTREAIDEAADQCAETMKAEPFATIPEEPVKKSFVSGSLEPDVDGMLRNVMECVEYQAAKPNEDPLREYILKHVRKDEVCLNTNGLELDSRLGYYSSGRSSAGAYMPDLHRSFAGFGETENPFDEALRKEKVKPLGRRFEGSIVLVPRFVRLYWWLSLLSLLNEGRTTGEDDFSKHQWADKFGQAVASPCFNLSNRPLDERFCNASPFTTEGYLARNVDLIKNGELKDLLYSGRCAKMLGRVPNASPIDYTEDDNLLPLNMLIEPGTSSIREIIGGIDKGLYLFSLPGGIPHNDEGTFSAVIRDGLLIEKGVVTRPVSQIMVTGNYYDLQKNIRGISSEYRFGGGDITPWIAFDGVNVQ